MAKGNLFLGMGRGKVGDVVFYRMNGWQMARVRNRTPKNPRSNEQLYQRAVIATVMKAYSLGKEIFDHSFQTYTVGEGCMRRFNSVNARILREELANDLAIRVNESPMTARFVAPRSTSATPIIGMQVSEGTLIQNFFEAQNTGRTYRWWTKTGSQLGTTQETKANEMLTNMNINAGDIFTFIFMMSDLNNPIYRFYPPSGIEDANATQYKTMFGWVRMIVKGEISDTITMANVKWSDLFEIEIGGNLGVTFNAEGKFETGSGILFEFPYERMGGVSACIRSRDDIDLRSTEFTIQYTSDAYGLTSYYVLDAWRQEIQKIGQSELILEGGEGLATMNINQEEENIEEPVVESPLTPRGRRKA